MEADKSSDTCGPGSEPAAPGCNGRDMPVQIPDDSDFSSFRDQCLSPDGWTSRYNKGGVTVWCREGESQTVQKLKVRIRSGRSNLTVSKVL